ncbi:MAG: hypothetical protein KGL43_28525 [Burkholderiales bacterium]|nr:hypothetical protein [Burkholderiales bacterium]
MRNGDTLISHRFNSRVIEVDASGNIVFQQGSVNVTGNGFDPLNGPHDAKESGDFTGSSAPPSPGSLARP